MEEPSKCAHLLGDLACAQGDVEEQCADIDSEEEIKVLHFKVHHHLKKIMKI
jgi:hypothetical protein